MVDFTVPGFFLDLHTIPLCRQLSAFTLPPPAIMPIQAANISCPDTRSRSLGGEAEGSEEMILGRALITDVGIAWQQVDRFPASLESEAGERTLSKVGF